MKRALLIAVVLVMALTIVTGTFAATTPLLVSGGGLKTTTTVKANSKYLIACIVKNSTNPYMIKQLDGFKAAGAFMGFDAVALAPAKADNIEEQVKIIEDLIQKGVKGLVIHPSDSNGIVPIVEKAMSLGIPVVVIGTPANTDKIFFRTGMDYTDSGRRITEAAIQKMGGKGNVIILEGPPQAINAKERLNGMLETIAKYPGVKVLDSQTANFNRLNALQVMENLLQKHKDVQGVFAANDEMALGAIQALEAAGRKNVVVSGVDGSKDASQAVLEGRLTVTSNADPYSSSWCAAAYIVKYLNDGTMPPSKFIPYPAEVAIIDKSNVQNYINNDAWWK